MRRSWHKYHHIQKGSECQLITALNAYYYLTGRYIKQDSPEYEKLMELTGAVAGCCTSVDVAWKLLGLRVLERYSSLTDARYERQSRVYRTTKETPQSRISILTQHYNKNLDDYPWPPPTKLPLPLEAVVWHKHTGDHSCLIVDQSVKVSAMRITNFQDATSSNGWAFEEDFTQYFENRTVGSDTGINAEGQQWLYRHFGLRKNATKDPFGKRLDRMLKERKNRCPLKKK